jgi:hypothetical protein
MESVKPRDATSDLPGSAKAAAASSSSSSSSSAAAAPAQVGDLGFTTGKAEVPNAALKVGARIEEVELDTDAQVDKFISELGRRLEKLGKSALASKKIAKIISNLTEETIKLGVLRLDDVGELKRIMTVKHNDMTTKQKKGDKKGASKAAPAKPTVALARNAFMVSLRARTHGRAGVVHFRSASSRKPECRKSATTVACSASHALHSPVSIRAAR